MRRFASLALVAILSVAVTAAAQAQLAVGLRGGFNSSKISIKEDGTSTEGLGSRSGFHAGAELAIGLSPMFGIQVGGVYSQKGAKESEGTASLTLAVDYIDVPVLFVVGVPTSGNVTPRIFAGGVASFEMSCKLKGSIDGQSASADCTDADFPRKKNYFAALFGVGVGLAAGPGSLLLDAGYQLGLTNVADEEGVTSKVNVIQVSLGYQFPLGN